MHGGGVYSVLMFETLNCFTLLMCEEQKLEV